METTLQAPVSVIETTLQKNNITEQVIAELKTKFLPMTIQGIEDKAGYKAADEARKVCKNLRVLASKLCKDGREEAITIQKSWIAAEKTVTGQISEVEQHLETEIERIDSEKERLRIEAETKEKERINSRIKALADYGHVADYSHIAGANEDQFAAMLAEAKQDYDKVLAEKAEQERLRLAEEQRLIAERQELEKQRAEQERKEAEFKAEQEKIAKAQQEREDALRAEQERMDKEKKEMEAAKQREADEKVAAEQREKQLEEEKRLAVEAARREDERNAQEERERKEAEALEAQRQEALRPDKEKLLNLGTAIVTITLPELSSEAGNVILNEVKDLLNKVQAHITKKVKAL